MSAMFLSFSSDMYPVCWKDRQLSALVAELEKKQDGWYGTEARSTTRVSGT